MKNSHGTNRFVASLVLVAVIATGAACQTAVAGRRCKSGIAEDATYVLTCKNGRWVRFISKADGLKLIAKIKAQQAAEDAAAAQVAAAKAGAQPGSVAPGPVVPTPTTPPATVDYFPPGSPDHFDVISAAPVGAVAPDVAAIRHELTVVGDWFSAQSGGRRPKFVKSGADIAVRSVTLSTNPAGTTAATVRRDLTNMGVPMAGAHALVYVTADPGQCSTTELQVSILFVGGSCSGNSPDANSLMGYGGTFLTAKELTHALGAVPSCATHSDGAGNVTDTASDVLYLGSAFPDPTNLTLDAGHDDYYRTGRTDCIDIANNPLW